MIQGKGRCKTVEAKIAEIACVKAKRDDYALWVSGNNILQAALMTQAYRELAKIKEWDDCGVRKTEKLMKQNDDVIYNNIVNLLMSDGK